ncbi:MAG: DUF4249 domain-containing protein [Bacteroides sp.]|nr:DUF4249 domain-containing protein [Bacteroides sp.]
MKQSIKYFILSSIVLVCLIPGCVSDYTPSGIEEVENLLVVEGSITGGETLIKLSRSVGLTADLDNSVWIENADVYIERSDNTRTERLEMVSPGEYRVEMEELSSELEYRLYIALDGKEYRSGFLAPLITPEMESLHYIKEGEGMPIYFCVNTHDPLNQSYYYRWTYEEYWEVWSTLFAAGEELEDGTILPYDLDTGNNIYYCWGNAASSTFILDSSLAMEGNRVRNKRLMERTPEDERFSVLYYIQVNQQILRKEAYGYFSNLQKNVEESSGLFAPMPTEVRGNIACESDPSLTMIGYIEVATTTTKERYVEREEGLYEPVSRSCMSYTMSQLMSMNPGMDEASLRRMYQYYYTDMNGNVYSLKSCLDCRTKANAGKNKPDFWPTDNL